MPFFTVKELAEKDGVSTTTIRNRITKGHLIAKKGKFGYIISHAAYNDFLKERQRKSLYSKYPNLMKEWDFERNKYDPKELTPKSNRFVWWICRECGYKWRTRVYVRSMSGCPRCAIQHKRLSFDYVKKCFENRGYKVLSTEYKSMRDNLLVLCPKGHKTKMSFANFSSGHGCNICGNQIIAEKCKKREYKSIYTEKYVKEYIASFGFELLSEYKKAKNIIDVRCPNGHICKTRFFLFKNGSRCARCAAIKNAEKTRFSYEYVSNFFAKFDYELLSEEYKNAGNKLMVMCPNGHRYTVTFSNFKSGYRCPVCARAPTSSVSQKWLDEKGVKQREVTLRDVGVRVDGYNPRAKIVYEFFGDYWHGNPDIYEMADINEVSKKTFGALYKKTMDRIDKLTSHGYTVVYIWEKDYLEHSNAIK